MKWPRSTLAAFVVCLTSFIAPASDLKKQPLVIVNGPSVIAFFEPVSKANLKNSPEINEALADFQLYAKSVQGPFADRRIKFYELYTSSFRIRIGPHTSTFRVGKVGVGYYLIAPDKQPRVKTGVMTDSDLLQEADDYFAKAGTSKP